MSKRTTLVNSAALLKNVAAITEAVEHALNRPSHLPGLVCFHGHSGFGKTTAALFLTVQFRAYHIEADSTCTRKELLLDIAERMGLTPTKTVRELKTQIGEQLAASRRPLIIDDAHHPAKKGFLELILDVYKKSRDQGTIVLIGEPALPLELKKHFERIDNRILRWVEANPLDMDDTRVLRDFYARGV
ncbi:MAG TPA: ATP-binding protein, partial [Magnetococcales bacterium]|nr:ATP-binding protein [Magnetococcales bacterium]